MSQQREYAPEARRIYQEFQRGGITEKIARVLLGDGMFQELNGLANPPPPVVVPRLWEDFYMTIVKVPSSRFNPMRRWALYGAVKNLEGKIIHTWMTDPAAKQLTLGKMKMAFESIFGEFDLRHGGRLVQLHTPTVSTLTNENVIAHHQLFQAPWFHICRSPWFMSIGAKAKFGKVGESIGIIGFDDKEELIMADRKRSYVLDEYQRSLGHLNSSTDDPHLLAYKHQEWKNIIKKRNTP